MKFWTGIIIGAAVSGYIVSGMTADRRKSTARAFSKAAAKVRSSHVGEAIVDGVSDIADAAGERASSVVHSGTSTVAGIVEPDGSTVTNGSIVTDPQSV